MRASVCFSFGLRMLLWMISCVCVYRGSAGTGGTSENKSRQAAWEEDKLRAGCYQQDSSHSYSLFSHTLRCSQIHRSFEDFIRMCFFYQILCLKVLCEQLVFSLLQVWLKRGNRIIRITILKDNKEHIKEKHNTWVKAEGVRSVTANKEDCRSTIKRVSQREFTPERGEQALILCWITTGWQARLTICARTLLIQSGQLWGPVLWSIKVREWRKTQIQIAKYCQRQTDQTRLSAAQRNTVNAFLSMSAGVLFCSSNSQYKEVIKLKETLVIQSAEQQDQISITC